MALRGTNLGEGREVAEGVLEDRLRVRYVDEVLRLSGAHVRGLVCHTLVPRS